MTWDPARRLLTIEEAARSVGRPASTIRRWLAEGRLTPTAKLGPRRPLILEADVLECDADTAHKIRAVSVAPETMKTPRESANSPGE